MNLTPEQVALVRELIRHRLGDVAVWAYGSRITGTARPNSDLDLVVFAGPERRADIEQLREDFEESDLPFRVDLFLWADLPESFRENIRNRHVELHPGNTKLSATGNAT